MLIIQTDFVNENANTKRMTRLLHHLDYIKIPKIYEEITNKYPNVIMMEFINGIKIKDVEKEDYSFFSKIVIKFGIITTIQKFIHGDFHHGNVIFIKNTDEECSKKTIPKFQIGIIDFGIIVKFETNVIQELMVIFIDFVHHS